MCTNGVLFIQRVNKIKTQVHKRYIVLQYGSIMAIEKNRF